MAFRRHRYERTEAGAGGDDRPARRSGYDLTRALFTLLGAAGAGLLIWLATLVGRDTDARWWIATGIVAGAGLALALSQLLGGWTKWGLPRLSAPVFLLAFVPAAVCVGWVLLTTQPDGGWQQARFENWSGDLGILGLVRDLAVYAPVLAFGLGSLFGYTFDTAGPRRQVVDRRRDVVMDRRDADEPVTAERTAAAAPVEREGDYDRDQDLVATRQAGTPVAPQPEERTGFFRRRAH